MNHTIANEGIYIIIACVLLVIVYNIYKYIKDGSRIYLIVIAGAITAFAGLIISYQNKKVGDIMAQVGYTIFIIGLTIVFFRNLKGH